jgi:non-heme chloroperoxidase
MKAMSTIIRLIKISRGFLPKNLSAVYHLAIPVGIAIFVTACSPDPTPPSDVSQSPQLKKVSVNGTELHYLEQGQGEPVVLVHGTLGDYRTWDVHLESFSKAYHVISYSRRYHYPNAWPADAASFSVQVHADDLVSFITKLDLGPVHVIGHSFGAYTALLATRDHPELVRSLTLAEPPAMPLLSSSPEGVALLEQFGQARGSVREAFARGEEKEAVSRFINSVLGPGAYENLSEEMLNSMLQNARELEGAMNVDSLFAPRSPLTCESLTDVLRPTMLVGGEISPKIFPLVLDVLEGCLSDSQRITVPQASHGMVFESPEFFRGKVLSFLEDQP